MLTGSLATAATLVSSLLQGQEYPDPKTRLETRNNAKWASLAPHHKSNNYVLAEFEDVFASISNKKNLQTEEYLKLLIETANKAVNKISSVYPDHNGAFVNGTNIKTQIAIMQKIMQSVIHKVEKKSPDKNLHEVLEPLNILLNFFLLNNLYYSSSLTNQYQSLETFANNFSIKANEINLFHTDITGVVYAELTHPIYQKVRGFLQELFPDQQVPSKLPFKTIKDKSSTVMGSCVNGNVYLCPTRIKEAEKINDNSEFIERYTTILNELLHHMMYKKFASSSYPQWHSDNLFQGENFATEFTVENNKQVEETISDITSLAFNPKYFIDMLRTPYPLTSALASKIVKEIIPGPFDHLKYYEWGNYSPSAIKADFVDFLKKQGIKEPDLERDLYLPAFKKLRVFALSAMAKFNLSVASTSSNKKALCP